MISSTDQPRERLCTACFTGVYPIELPDAHHLGKNLLERPEAQRGEGEGAAADGCDPGPDAEYDSVLLPTYGDPGRPE
jgi:amidophosphoribosyltransferase